MKLFILSCFFSLLLLNPSVGFSQKENPKEVEISGVKYVLHTVKKSETVFSLCQKYKVTQSDLKQANPGLTTILQAGSTIKIPVGKVDLEPKKQETNATQPTEEEYYYHKIGKKQTLVSIASQYGVSANDLIRNNPELTKGLVVGQVIKIPISLTISGAKTETKSSADSETKDNLTDFTIHPVVSGETLYSLEKKYELTHEEMLKYNPSLQNGLKSGMKLKIPAKRSPKSEEQAAQTVVQQVPNTVETESGNCLPLTGNTGQKYKVGMLLPLYLSGNDAASINKATLLSKINFTNQPASGSFDTTLVINGINIDQRAIGFLEFYEGALLAIDSLQRKGMNVELFVFDSSNQNMINSLLQMDEFRDLNLIIGPVFPELQEKVAEFAAKNRIPMVSPLSPIGNLEQNNSWYFKVNPTREYQIDQTVSYIVDEFSNKNFFMLQQSESSNSAEAQLSKLCKEKMAARSGKNLFHEYNFQQLGVNEIKPLLDETGENVFVIPTDNEAQVSITVTNLTALAEHYDIVLLGTPSLIKLKSIQTENYHRVRLRYLSPYFVDYTKTPVRRFVSQYRETFSAEPSQFSFQGFDVSYYFLSALYRYGKDFRNCLPDYPMELTQMNFNFRKVGPTGGFLNHSLFITAYERNFDVLNYGAYGKK
jgi:LysM repeat protein